MSYKGYTGQITTIDEQNGLIHGVVANINDVVSFEGRNPKELVKAFHDSVDDYLEFCAEEDDEPEKPYSGRFLLRMPPEIHRAATLKAKQENKSLNLWILTHIQARLKSQQSQSSSFSE